MKIIFAFLALAFWITAIVAALVREYQASIAFSVLAFVTGYDSKEI